jgi:hypothetical protein
MKIKFLHVPKTAGTSIRSFLQRFFLSRHVCPARDNAEFLALSPEQRRSYRLFAGHFDWAHLDQIEGECFTFSILRRPQERVVSFYFYLRARGARLDGRSLELDEKRGLHAALTWPPDAFFCDGGTREVRRHLDAHFDNFYAYYFAGRSFDARRRVEVGRTISEAELLARANQNLDALDGLYSMDDLSALEQDVVAACARGIVGRWGALRTRFSPLSSLNLNRSSGDHASRIAELKSLGATQRTFDRIEEMTRLDDVIWKQVTSRRRP